MNIVESKANKQKKNNLKKNSNNNNIDNSCNPDEIPKPFYVSTYEATWMFLQFPLLLLLNSLNDFLFRSFFISKVLISVIVSVSSSLLPSSKQTHSVSFQFFFAPPPTSSYPPVLYCCILKNILLLLTFFCLWTWTHAQRRKLVFKKPDYHSNGWRRRNTNKQNNWTTTQKIV